MIFETFKNRAEAGRLLGEALAEKKFTDPVVLALPRGGVPVAVEVGRQLHAPVDLVLVRKIGVPFQPELAAGAVVDGGEPETVYDWSEDHCPTGESGLPDLPVRAFRDAAGNVRIGTVRLSHTSSFCRRYQHRKPNTSGLTRTAAPRCPRSADVG